MSHWQANIEILNLAAREPRKSNASGIYLPNQFENKNSFAYYFHVIVRYKI